MLKQCDESWITRILEYIGRDYSKCLYLYINLNKYGLNTENFNVWISLDDVGDIRGLMAKYYTGTHFFSKDTDFIVDDYMDFVHENKPAIITGTGQIIQNIQGGFPSYTADYGSVGQIKNVSKFNASQVEIASIDDMHEIAKLLIGDKGLGGHYDSSLLEHQLKERYIEGFGRNYVIKKDNEIVSHCATYAQTNQLAVTSGVFTKTEERGMGYAYQIYCKLCYDLLSEGKEVYAFFYTDQAHRMHDKVGFKVVSSWAKLVLQK
ncbi:GNAT family N-acetyltransferase [Paenibacillus dakarensis]|uniref:GNAT family N-acetyltransferase n=1 Tax=Paenibacillus dakarensis TaxID=1527293 RepID=UPI0006D58F61|nr:GNAT family N-acetyltransferase [Paenibacillus dakarensis]